MSEDIPRVIFLVLMLVIVGSSLLSRQLPLAKSLRIGLAWAGIFGIIFILVVFRHDFATLGERLSAEFTGDPISEGEEVRIAIGSDGHFWTGGTINGHQVRFLVDSGASTTTVSQETATAAGLETGFRAEQVETANGTVVMKKSRAESLRIGSIERSDIGINVNPNDNINVLGMNFLSSLKSWKVEGRFLVLQS
jgi:aspartyl protease family protein